MKLTQEEATLIRNAYNNQKKMLVYQDRRDRLGREIRMLMTFEEWLTIWVDSGKLHLRGRGAGKFCMARNDDLGHYQVGNVSIKSWEENSREAKLGRPGLKGRVSPTKGIDWKPETRAKRSASARNRRKSACSHCGSVQTAQAHGRYHGPRCPTLRPRGPAAS